MTATYRVLFHLPDEAPERHAQVLRNVENLLKDFAPGEVEVEIVANAGGLMAFSAEQSTVQAHVARLAERGVDLAACSNGLGACNLTPDQLLPNVRVVSSGVGEIVRKQADGWLYLRP